jgi:hypothetical protein
MHGRPDPLGLTLLTRSIASFTEGVMHSLITRVAVCVFGALVASSVFAQPLPLCPSGSARVSDLQTFLQSKMVCAKLSDRRWQEHHQGAGAAGSVLVDYKLGPGHPVDPTKQVGTWQATTGTASEVTYTYGSLVFRYFICAVPSVASATSYTFVPVAGAGTLITGATIFASASAVACP